MDSPGDMYPTFCRLSVKDLEKMLVKSSVREERAFYRTLINLKLQIDQEKIVGKKLL